MTGYFALKGFFKSTSSLSSVAKSVWSKDLLKYLPDTPGIQKALVPDPYAQPRKHASKQVAGQTFGFWKIENFQ